MKKTLYTVLLALLMTSMVGCQDNDDATQVTLSFDVTLPVDMQQESLNTEAAATRAIGDPGLTEYFERPRYLYLFLAVGDPTTPTSNPIYFYSIQTAQSDWSRTADSLVFTAKFTQKVNWSNSVDLTSLKNGNLRAYMVASYNAITTDPNGFKSDSYNQVTSSVTTESQLLNLKFWAFDGTSDYSKMSLRDIYSTPFNLSSDWTLMDNATTDRTGYYGTVTNITGQGQSGFIAIKDTLYHLASKVDFQWNSVEQGQNNVMQSIVINNCPKEGYLFRPTVSSDSKTYSKVLLNNADGSVSADDTNNSHEAHYADADQADAGNQWSGRAYTYLLQPGNLNYTVTTNANASAGGVTTTSTPTSNGTTNEIFAAWYKLNFRIKASN